MAEDINKHPVGLSNHSLLHDVENNLKFISTSENSEEVDSLITTLGGKRSQPEDGHSPTGYSPAERRMANSGHFEHQLPLGASPILQPAPGPTSTSAIPSQNRSGAFDFIVKSNVEITLNKLVVEVGKLLPAGTFFSRHILSRSKKVALFKTKNASRNPTLVLNTLLKEEVQKSLREGYGENSLTVHHHDPTIRSETDHKRSFHVIATQVPRQYSMDYLLSEIQKHNPDLKYRLESCHRIVSRNTNRETELVRIICSDLATADKLVNEGLCIEYIWFDCERSYEKSKPVQRCFRCQGEGHLVQYCLEKERCGKCGDDSHRSRFCTKSRDEYKCLSCGERHAVWDLNCRVNIRANDSERKDMPSTQSETIRYGPPSIGSTRVNPWGPTLPNTNAGGHESSTPDTTARQIAAAADKISSTSLTATSPVTQLPPVIMSETQSERFGQEIEKMNHEWTDKLSSLKEDMKTQTKTITDLINSKMADQKQWLKQKFQDSTKSMEKDIIEKLQGEWTNNINDIKIKLDHETKSLRFKLSEFMTKMEDFNEKQVNDVDEMKAMASSIPETVGTVIRTALKTMRQENNNLECPSSVGDTGQSGATRRSTTAVKTPRRNQEIVNASKIILSPGPGTITSQQVTLQNTMFNPIHD